MRSKHVLVLVMVMAVLMTACIQNLVTEEPGPNTPDSEGPVAPLVYDVGPHHIHQIPNAFKELPEAFLGLVQQGGPDDGKFTSMPEVIAALERWTDGDVSNGELVMYTSLSKKQLFSLEHAKDIKVLPITQIRLDVETASGVFTAFFIPRYKDKPNDEAEMHQHIYHYLYPEAQKNPNPNVYLTDKVVPSIHPER